MKIHPRAAGGNFRHVLLALGHIRGTFKGCGEVSSTVTDAGSALENRFQVGDRVVALGCNTYTSAPRVKGKLAQIIPAEITFSVAASIPAAYLTVYYTLVHLAHLRPGKTVLIHSAAGGVGIVTVQICKHIGKQVFATVGNDKKKIFLN